MALRFSLFSTPKHRTFTYTPRLWNPEKEEREVRWRSAEEEAGVSRAEDKDKPYQPNIKGQFRKNLESTRRVNTSSYSKRLGTIIVLVTIGVLFLAIFYMAKLFPFLVTGGQ